MTLLETPCIEVCKGDTLRGYAIFFSGGWDAYLADGSNSLLCIGKNFATQDAAVGAIRIGWDWRKRPGGEKENE